MDRRTRFEQVDTDAREAQAGAYWRWNHQLYIQDLL